jgi:hypothetical protein
MVSFSLPEVEGLGKAVKGLPSYLFIEVCQGDELWMEFGRLTGWIKFFTFFMLADYHSPSSIAIAQNFKLTHYQISN